MTVIESLAGSQANVQKKEPAKTVIGSDFETFLKMLTTQLKNQDPLNPMESSDFAVQLATFSSVEQQVLTNDILTGLSNQFGQMGLAQLATWVGMKARAPLPVQFDGFPVTLYGQVASTADSARLAVRDQYGTLVQSVSLPVSSEPFVWAGRDAAGQTLPYGVYSFTVESLQEDRVIDSQVPETFGVVQEARVEAGRTILVMDGGAQVDADRVTALRK